MRFVVTTSLIALAAHLVAGQGVVVVSPAQGASIAAGTETIELEDSGAAPAVSLLAAGEIALYVGGNTDADSLRLATLGTIAYPNLLVPVNIAPGLAASVPNGFYLKITSNLKEGGTVINYSNRFSLTGMVGTTEQRIRAAATAAGNAVPRAVVQAAAAPAAGGAAAGAEMFNIPFNSQTGLTKYAPMQPIPPTKITKGGNPTPLFPTSAYTLATTWLPRASIVTTVTQSQTFSVESIENPVSPQSLPTGKDDMAKFLARWKD